MLRSVTGLQNVVFGTDYPYPHNEVSIGGLRSVEATEELADDERRSILACTASRLFPRLAAVAEVGDRR
jgi:aminocarboxymuconate-semialdehyde decarboxylase